MSYESNRQFLFRENSPCNVGRCGHTARARLERLPIPGRLLCHEYPRL